MLKDSTLEEAKAAIAEYDRDGDGTIGYEEFIRMVLPKDAKVRIAH